MKNTGEYFDLTKTFPRGRLGCRATAATTCRAAPAEEGCVCSNAFGALSHRATRAWKSRFIFSPRLSGGIALEEPRRTPACLSARRVAGLQVFRNHPFLFLLSSRLRQIWRGREESSLRTSLNSYLPKPLVAAARLSTQPAGELEPAQALPLHRFVSLLGKQQSCTRFEAER